MDEIRLTRAELMAASIGQEYIARRAMVRGDRTIAEGTRWRTDGPNDELEHRGEWLIVWLDSNGEMSGWPISLRPDELRNLYLWTRLK